jgi:hypothetical protein
MVTSMSQDPRERLRRVSRTIAELQADKRCAGRKELLLAALRKERDELTAMLGEPARKEGKR